MHNERDEPLKVTFWNEDMNLILPTLNNNGPTPIFAATSTAVSNFGGKIGDNASRGTKVMIDPNIPKAAELRQSITTPSPGRPEKRLLSSEITRTTREIRIALAKGTTGFNLCIATIQQVYEDEVWKYSSCTRCHGKLTLTGMDYKCYARGTWEHTPDGRYNFAFSSIHSRNTRNQPRRNERHCKKARRRRGRSS